MNYDHSTPMGRLLCELKFCAVRIFLKNGDSFFATRCMTIKDYEELPDCGIDGTNIKMSIIEYSKKDDAVHFIKEETIDFNDIENYYMAKVGSRAYLDCITHYD